ncbi:MAG: DUF2336 domain-containing protein [Alsobacter sp.]
MTSTALVDALIIDLQLALETGVSADHMPLLRTVSDTVPDRPGDTRQPHVAGWDAVIVLISRNLEFRSRVTLSEWLADCRHELRGASSELGADPAIAIAGPVLERSRWLDDTAIAEIIALRGSDHHMAISRRDELSEAITDRLVDLANAAVDRSLAGNTGARLSADGATTLAGRSEGDPDLRAVLSRRSDLPAQATRLMADDAATHATLKVGLDTGVDEDVIDVTVRLARPDDDLHTIAVLSVDDFRQLQAGMTTPANGQVDGEIMRHIEAGRIARAVVVLALQANVSPTFVRDLLLAETIEPLIVLAKAAPVSWETLEHLLVLKLGRALPQDMRHNALSTYAGLGSDIAGRAMRTAALRYVARLSTTPRPTQ